MQNHWKYLFISGIFPIAVSLALFLFMTIFTVDQNELTITDSSFIFGYILIIIVITIVPILYVHFHYWYINKDVSISDSGIRWGNTYFSFEDVSQIWVYKPKYNSSRVNPFSDYFYIKLVLRDRVVIYLTSLITEKIDEFTIKKCKNARVFYENGTFANFPDW